MAVSMKPFFAKQGDQMPRLLSNNTDPRRTGERERRLVLGAPGPKELYLSLIG